MRTIYFIVFITVMALSGQGALAQSGNEKAAKVSNPTNTENASGQVITITKKDFLEKVYNYEKNREQFIYEGTLPCIIDFYADWCGYCKIVDPILKDLANEYKGKIVVYKVYTDNERELARAFGIQALPSYFFIPAKGDPVVLSGAKPRETFVQMIDDLLLKK